MSQGNWEADKMLDVYIHDYLMKRNLTATAKTFLAEGKVSADPVAIDAPGGFLFEWWSVFWDIFIARTNEKHSDVAAAYLESQKTKDQVHMQQYQPMQRQAQLQRRDPNHPALNGSMNDMSTNGILGSPASSTLSTKLLDERLKNPHAMDYEVSPHLLDANNRMTLLKSGTNHPGQFVQGHSSNSTLQQIQARTQQAPDMKVDMGLTQRSLNMDPSLYSQGIVQGKSALGGAGLNQGVIPLKGWPLTGNMEQLRSSLSPQGPRPFISSTNQYQAMAAQQQQMLAQAQAQAQAQGTLANSRSYGEMDPRRSRALPVGALNGRDGQPSGNDGTIGSPMQTSSPVVRQDQPDYFMKLDQNQMQQPPAQLPQEHLSQQHQMQQLLNNRKRKPTSSGAANSTGTGNTIGPSSSPPSTPSTNTPGDGITMAGNLPHVGSMVKSSLYGTNVTSGLASSSNHMDEMDHFGDMGALDDNVDSFLHDPDSNIFASLKNGPTDNTDTSKGLTFSEIGCNRTSNNKVLCCHFSSDGKLLASAGHEKKVLIWNMGTLQTETMPEEHALLITDIRFRPDSTQLATSSFDKTVRLWDSAEPSFSLHTFTGHSSQVASLDFHPKKTDFFCSCDNNGEVRLWNVSQRSGCTFSKGAGSHQVRFQPGSGQFLAVAADSGVSIFDFETKRKTWSLQGHNQEVQSVCWDANGAFVASVSHDVVKVWSIASGERVHELNSNGNNFHSCVFHPTYPNLLVIGGYQSIHLWDIAENKNMSATAHEGLITSLAQTGSGTIASASHDKSVKLWK